MKTLLRAFARKQVRRARAATLPALLALAMMGLAFTRLPSANTLWYETLTMTSDVSTGQFACQPYAVALTATTVTGGNTTYTYTFTGGGISGPECRDNVSYVALQVCFDPVLAPPAGPVVSETHPAATTSPPSSWSYGPDNIGGVKRVKWNGTGVGPVPFSATFSFTLNGTGMLTTSSQFQVHAGLGDTTGAVEVPWAASCGTRNATTSGAGSTTGVGTYSSRPAPSAPRTTSSGTTDGDVPPTATVSGSKKSGGATPTATPARPGGTYNGTYEK